MSVQQIAASQLLSLAPVLNHAVLPDMVRCDFGAVKLPVLIVDDGSCANPGTVRAV